MACKRNVDFTVVNSESRDLLEAAEVALARTLQHTIPHHTLPILFKKKVSAASGFTNSLEK